MADEASKRMHGPPMPIPSFTKEPEAATDFGIGVRPTFFLDLSQYGGPANVPFTPTPRMIDRIVRAMAQGTPGQIEAPSDPKPNGYPRIPPPQSGGQG